MSDEELTLETVVQEFIDIFEIRKQAEPQIRGEFENEFADKTITRQYVNEFASELIDKILRASDVMKQKLAELVEVHGSKYHVAVEEKRKWKEFPEKSPCEPDLSIIVDATQVIKGNSVNTVLSGDSDILALQEIANSYFGFSILSMADEYSVTRKRRADT
jgi:hypothetical protein